MDRSSSLVGSPPFTRLIESRTNRKINTIFLIYAHPRKGYFKTVITDRSQRRLRGQALVEYAITVGVIIALVSCASLLLYVFKENGGRILDLVASEYP
jgi:hypothetical protein